METVEFHTWEECEAWILNNANTPRFLFRGQSDAAWKLETTLERYFPENKQLSLIDYYARAYRAKDQVEIYTGQSWNMSHPNDHLDWLKKCRGDSINFDFNLDYINNVYKNMCYEYLAYLRHLGFPSPLLDWSRSPYVATFFAFNRAQADKVAIFVYNERPDGAKSGSSGESSIYQFSPLVKSHRRHYAQQSCYTICCLLQPLSANTHSHYSSHEDVFSLGDNSQDALWKLVMPAAEKLKVLNRLNAYNLNAHTLFGSEESLVETLAFNEFFGREGLSIKGGVPDWMAS